MRENRRSQQRKRATGPVRYCCSDQQKKPQQRREKLEDVGILVNVSEAGLCFITTCPLEVGQALVINCPWIMDEVEEGTVRWCRKAATDLWRIGLMRRTNGNGSSE